MESSDPRDFTAETNGDTANFKALTPQPATPDPFEPASLRLGADFSEGLGVRKVISTIPCRKPGKTVYGVNDEIKFVGQRVDLLTCGV